MLTRDRYCREEIIMRITMAKEVFNRQISLLTSELNIELRKKFFVCFILSTAMYGSKTLTLRNWSGSINF